MARWVDGVECWGCINRSDYNEWQVVDGVWTCTCGAPMTIAAIADYHAKGLQQMTGSDPLT